MEWITKYLKQNKIKATNRAESRQQALKLIEYWCQVTGNQATLMKNAASVDDVVYPYVLEIHTKTRNTYKYRFKHSIGQDYETIEEPCIDFFGKPSYNTREVAVGAEYHTIYLDRIHTSLKGSWSKTLWQHIK